MHTTLEFLVISLKKVFLLVMVTACCFGYGFFNCSACAQAHDSETHSKIPFLPGRVEIDNVTRTDVADTPAHHWSSVGSRSYIDGEFDKAEQAFEKALSLADSSKLTFEQKAQVIANLACVKREKRQFDESEKLFKKSLEVLHTDSKIDPNVHEYIMSQFRRLYRMQGKNDQAEFLFDNTPPAQKLAVHKTRSRGVPIQLSATDYLEEISTCFCGLKASPTIKTVTKEELSNRAFVEGKEAPLNAYREWYRIPKGLAGKWRPKGMVDEGFYNLPRGSNYTIRELMESVPGVMQPCGLQVDAAGDIWDFDHYLFLPSWRFDAASGYRRFVEIAKVSSLCSDPNTLCILSSGGSFLVEDARMKAESVNRFQMLQREAVIDGNSISFAVSSIAYDEKGKPIHRSDYHGTATRVAEFQKDDRYTESFVKFLESKGLTKLIPPE